MSLTSGGPAERCPDCKGSLQSIELVARGPDGPLGSPLQSIVRFYATADAERVRSGAESRTAGHVRATLCTQCHRIFLFGVPSQLGVPAKVEVASPVERAAEEPLRLSRDASEGFQFLRVSHEAHHSIVEVLGEHVGPLNDVTLQQISHEFGEALEACHPRTLLDLGNFVPPAQASVFVTVLIKLKKRWLEKHTVPGDPAGDGAKGAAQPTVKQLSFPVFKARGTGLKTLESITDGSCELALCGVPNALVDVLKVTRLLRAPPI